VKKGYYKDALGPIKWHIERFGLLHIINGVISKIFAPVIISTLKPSTFSFRKKTYPLLYHRYNTTWKNERCLEVPLVKSLIDNGAGDVLEIGNVLSHYYPLSWDVLDKFEKAERVINEDLLSFVPSKKYELVVSISTFEHIGFDDDLESNFKNSAEKIQRSFENITKNILKKNGKVAITAPIGYNPDMDSLIFKNGLKFDEIYFYKKDGDGKWGSASKDEAEGSKYNYPHPYANCIALGIKEKSD